MLADVLHRFEVGQVIGAEDPVMGGRVERVSHSDYSSAQGYVSAFQSDWITGSVPAFVVMTHEWHHLGKRGTLSDYVGPDVRVAAYHLPFFRAEWPRFTENVVADSDHAEIVQRSGGTEELDFVLVKLEVLAETASQLRDAGRVGIRVGIASLHLGRPIEGPTFEFSLPLNASDCVTDSQDEAARHES